MVIMEDPLTCKIEHGPHFRKGYTRMTICNNDGKVYWDKDKERTRTNMAHEHEIRLSYVKECWRCAENRGKLGLP